MKYKHAEAFKNELGATDFKGQLVVRMHTMIPLPLITLNKHSLLFQQWRR